MSTARIEKFKFSSIIFLIICQSACVSSIKKSNEFKNVTIVKDDLTTEFAKQIIKRAKAADINAMLNVKINPCDDFYAYACGNWHRHNPAQLLTNIVTDTFQQIAKSFDRRLLQVLQSPKLENDLERNVQNFYQSCKLVHKDDVHYRLSLENAQMEFGEFPVVAKESWNQTNFNWVETIAKIQHKYGKQIILAVDIMGDIQNNTINRVYVGPPDYSMSSNSKLISLLEEATIALDLQHYFGVEKGLASKTAKQLNEFERKLAFGGANNRENTLQDLLTLKPVDEVISTFADHFDFQEFLQIVLGEQVPKEIYIYDEIYLKKIFETIKAVPKDILANYIMWQLLQEYLLDAADADLQKWCVEKTKKYFGKYIDYMVYARYKSAEVETSVYQVWDEIRSTFRDQLKGDKFDWISNLTRTYAIEKLDNMQLEINSYADENFNMQYENLTIDRSNFVQNIQKILVLESGRYLQNIEGPPRKMEDPETLSYTAAYSIQENVIKIPVALLQPHFFWDINCPQVLKYATLGYLLAHEMVHGFDDEGRKYDKDGNLHNWWDAKSTYEFEERRKCFQAQYHNYKYGGIKLPDSISQAENIADNAGVKLAYSAYMRWLKKERELNADIDQQETLPGLSLNNVQLFFTGYAQVWCDDVQTLFKSSFASADTHAPGMFRVIGSLSNFQEFSWVFNCSQDARMDPEFKCTIY